jgi:hypothetical protein
METIFGRRRQDSIAVEWSSKVLYVLEFKRTSDRRRNYRDLWEARARAQHNVLVKSLEKLAGEAVGENSGWKIKLIIFVGGTCGSVHVDSKQYYIEPPSDDVASAAPRFVKADL